MKYLLILATVTIIFIVWPPKHSYQQVVVQPLTKTKQIDIHFINIDSIQQIQEQDINSIVLQKKQDKQAIKQLNKEVAVLRKQLVELINNDTAIPVIIGDTKTQSKVKQKRKTFIQKILNKK